MDEDNKIETTEPQETIIEDKPQPSDVNLKTDIYVEAMDLVEATIDAERRTVRQRLIRAGRSNNNRVYPEKVLRGAVPLFEGVQTYANHPAKGERARSVRELTGWIDEVTYEEGALYGTRHFLRTQSGSDSWSIIEDIVTGRAPARLMGASINAVGKGKMEKQKDGSQFIMVESIEAVHSVDDVTAAAAGGGWERELVAGSEGLAQEFFNALTYQEFIAARPDYIEKYKRETRLVRLGEETKTALAESDNRVKTASAKLAESQTALLEAQEQVETLTEVNARLQAEFERARRELAVYEALKDVSLPRSYKQDLRERLPLLPLEEWQQTIEKEVAKARAANALPRVEVTGGGQRVSQNLAEGRETSPAPMPDEDFDRWQKRLRRGGK
jgi:hypothetical protein